MAQPHGQQERQSPQSIKKKNNANSWKDGPRRNLESTLKPHELPNIKDKTSVLGEEWCGLFEMDVGFQPSHYKTAMSNLIKNPNINSTVILRADVLIENKYTYDQSEKQSVEQYRNDNPEELLLDRNDNGSAEETILSLKQ
ncbi:unnamed protein product [Ambrosiozyma monospora]|uniref:Unnamed protein product n=1 Tax=Ambrosiozyma monospora TaxID=43982 RepID=A0ACB5U4V5_AMBMO|nr:unnamed protein product [Ambrosiozyma monospora]